MLEWIKKPNLDSSIINEFKSKYIELCSEWHFVTEFISLPNDVDFFGFTPDTEQNELESLGLTYTSGEEHLFEPTYNFRVEYHLTGKFYYYKKANSNRPFEIQSEFSLKFDGCIRENGEFRYYKVEKLNSKKDPH